mmetsp:Transcript_13679/g.15901  ORF Transcript_13679/g.15901 Transcript_13679/m.15901 type:complete len:96 (-) Transcript_13679:43-330(-)
MPWRKGRGTMSFAWMCACGWMECPSSRHFLRRSPGESLRFCPASVWTKTIFYNVQVILACNTEIIDHLYDGGQIKRGPFRKEIHELLLHKNLGYT